MCDGGEGESKCFSSSNNNITTTKTSTSSELVIPLSRLITVSDLSFAVAGPRLWNTLPEDITSAQSLLVFRRKLKMHFF